MRKLYILLCITLFAVSGCEKDDFCIDPVTPNLIIRFYDDANPTSIKSVADIHVWAENKDSIFTNTSLDSISIPLDVNTNQTIYNISKGTTQDQITVSYDVEEVFVSRSCGYKAIFNNVTISNSSNWIQSVNPTTINTIENEFRAHVQIFH